MIIQHNTDWINTWNELFYNTPCRFEPPPSRFDIRVWVKALHKHPDQQYFWFIIDGISRGFDIGNNGIIPTGKRRNLPTNNFEKIKITQWLFKGVTKGYILGPFTDANLPIKNLIVSPVGAVPKDVTGIRPIHHLSAPRYGIGISVNSTLFDKYKTVNYVKFKEIVAIAYAVGKNGFLWTADAADAYLRVPIKRKDWRFTGIRWNKYYFILTCLPFGLSSSCLLYTLFADAIEWIVVYHNKNLFDGIIMGKYIQLIRHYLDDFVGGNNNFNIACKQFDSLVYWFNKLNVPTRDNKCSPPAQQQVILGTLFDTVTQLVKLPADKRLRYSDNIIKVLNLAKQGKRITKKDLQQLNGRLRFAARHIWCGEAFFVH